MDVKRVAVLANLPLTDEELKSQEKSLLGVMTLVDHIQKLQTEGVEATAQVTGRINSIRPDEIDSSRILSQQDALSNAPATQDGFFKVKAIFED